MDTMREGGSVVIIPLLDRSNYSFWKGTMKAFLKSLDEKVWLSMCYGWTTLLVTIDGENKPKPMEKWISYQFATSGFLF